MKILVLNWRDMEHPEAGGAEVHFVENFTKLVENGHEVTLLTTKFKNCQTESVYKGIRVLRLANNFLFHLQAASLVKKIIKDNDYDIIVDDVNKLPFYTHKHVKVVPTAAIFHHMFGKTVFGLTNFPMALYVYLSEKMYGRRYKNVDSCAVSPSTAEELVRLGMNREKLTIIENGIDVKKYCPDDTITREDNLLLFIGRLKKYKRVDYIFEAMKIIADNNVNTNNADNAVDTKNIVNKKLKLVVIGAGDDLPRLKKRAAKLNVIDDVEFVGFVDEQKKIDFLRKSAIFVNPSEKEGWGITNIEAAACGLPVVANDAPGLRDSVVHNETGLLYETNDVNSLASSIQKLLDDKSLKKTFGDNGVMWAQKFSWDASAKRTEEWLLKTVTRN